MTTERGVRNGVLIFVSAFGFAGTGRAEPAFAAEGPPPRLVFAQDARPLALHPVYRYTVNTRSGRRAKVVKPSAQPEKSR